MTTEISLTDNTVTIYSDIPEHILVFRVLGLEETQSGTVQGREWAMFTMDGDNFSPGGIYVSNLD